MAMSGLKLSMKNRTVVLLHGTWEPRVQILGKMVQMKEMAQVLREVTSLEVTLARPTSLEASVARLVVPSQGPWQGV